VSFINILTTYSRLIWWFHFRFYSLKVNLKGTRIPNFFILKNSEYFINCTSSFLNEDRLSDYEVRTLLRLGIFGVRHMLVSDTDIYDYIKLCHFFKLLSVSTYKCMCCVRCPCLCSYFIGFWFLDCNNINNS
jgi:hypothetical protein